MTKNYLLENKPRKELRHMQEFCIAIQHHSACRIAFYLSFHQSFYLDFQYKLV